MSMITKLKRKNSDTILTRYDKGGLYACYRWLRLSRTMQIAISVSPEICIMHLQQAKAYYWKREIFSSPISNVEVFPLNHGAEYEFQAKVVKAGRGGSQIYINGLIVENGDGQSLVMLRTYSHSGFISIGCMMMWILFSLIQQYPPEGIALGILIFGSVLMLFYLIGIEDQVTSYNIISDYITQSQHLLTPGQTELTPKQAKRLRRNSRKHYPF
jgi:hypothetical protein